MSIEIISGCGCCGFNPVYWGGDNTSTGGSEYYIVSINILDLNYTSYEIDGYFGWFSSNPEGPIVVNALAYYNATTSSIKVVINFNWSKGTGRDLDTAISYAGFINGWACPNQNFPVTNIVLPILESPNAATPSYLVYTSNHQNTCATASPKKFTMTVNIKDYLDIDISTQWYIPYTIL